jgi:hypothetical protein
VRPLRERNERGQSQAISNRDRSRGDSGVQLTRLSADDPELLFALRRRLLVKLTHDERGTPAHRNKIKRLKMIEQDGKCPICSKALPEKYAELDRFKASAGYTLDNTRLVHHECHISDQAKKSYL